MGNTKVELSKHIGEAVEEHLAHVREEWSRDPSGVGEVAAEVGALPLILDFGGFCGLRRDGTFIEVPWDEPARATEVTSHRMRDTALKSGSERYPFLAALLPRRSSNARTCPQCGGTGVHPLAATSGANIVCWCGGLGWIPDYWEEDPPRAGASR
jgi:hypothetical protein